MGSIFRTFTGKKAKNPLAGLSCAPKGNTLFEASRDGKKEVAQSLIDEGAPVNYCNKYGNTPLHVASSQGHKDMVAMLLSCGAQVNVQDMNGDTPLHRAASSGNADIADVLLMKGARIDIQDYSGTTPLYAAASEGRKETVRLLVEKGADVSIADKHGETPLHKAVSKGDEEIVTLLILSGADINKKNKQGRTPLSWASNDKIIKLLIDRGAKIDQKDKAAAKKVILNSLGLQGSLKPENILPARLLDIESDASQLVIPGMERENTIIFNHRTKEVMKNNDRLCDYKTIDALIDRTERDHGDERVTFYPELIIKVLEGAPLVLKGEDFVSWLDPSAKDTDFKKFERSRNSIKAMCAQKGWEYYE
ncbi:MAG: ankyrin repeat domain-containing protein [Vulcanimicrobiota bacterium]